MITNMNIKEIILSSSGLKNIIFPFTSKDVIVYDATDNEKNVKEEDSFYFHLSNKTIRMNRILAEFISPRVSHMHQTDLTIDSLDLSAPFFNQNNETKDDQISTELIENFVKLSKGLRLRVDEEMSYKLLELAISLGNEEMYQQIVSLFKNSESEKKIDQITIMKHIQYLQYFEENNQKNLFLPSFNFESIIDIISSHFYLIDQSSLKRLSRRILYLIISNKNLKLKNEDSLFDFINDIFSNNGDKNEIEALNKMIFYEEIIIENLSTNKKNELYSNIESSQMTHELWNNLRNILIVENQNIKKKVVKLRYADKEETNEKITKIKFNNDSNNRFKGIVSHICNGEAKSAIEKGIIDITASSIEASSEQPINALLYDKDDSFVSNDVPNSWLCIDFKNNKVNPTHYSIKTYGRKSYVKPKSWCIEGSNDEKEWDTIDKKENEISIDGEFASNTFEIRKEKLPNKYYRYIRIRQTGTNSNNDHRFIIHSLEYFGSLQSS